MAPAARARRSAVAAVLCAIVLAPTFLSAPRPTAAAGNTLRIEPADLAVAKDATFDVTVIQNAEAETSGAQATITFDPELAQITAVTKGAAYTAAPVFTGATEDAITAANGSGRLSTVALAFLPPGSVPVGDQDVLVITFRAVGCGALDLDLPIGPADGALLDGRAATYGAALPT